MSSKKSPTYPTFMWEHNTGIMCYFASTGDVAVALDASRSDASSETPSSIDGGGWRSRRDEHPCGLMPRYKAPPNLEHLIKPVSRTYALGWDAQGKCYALEHNQFVPFPRRDIGPLEEMLAEMDEREAQKRADKLAEAQAERERLEREAEAQKARLAELAAEHERATKAVQSASGELGQAKKAANASRKVADAVTKEVAA